MKLINHQVRDFINAVDSSKPAPGGGSVSALAGALGVSLAKMVGHLTLPKKAYKKRLPMEQKLFEDTLASLLEMKEKLIKLVDKDTDAFNLIMAAFQLPKETNNEKSDRQQAIEEATIKAIEVPLEVALISLRALKILHIIEEYGNKNCLSDIGVSALQLESAVKGALMNVKINVSGLRNESLVVEYSKQVQEIFHETTIIAEDLVQDIFSKL